VRSLSQLSNHLLTCFQDDNKTKIAKSGALVPLTRLARSKDMRVQRNATGALLNMTHSGIKTCFFLSFHPAHGELADENRQQLVNAGAIPVLVSLLNSPDTDVQYYCTTALSNIAVDGANRKKLAQGEPKLVASLVALMDSTSLKVQCQAALALRNLASDGRTWSFMVLISLLTSLQKNTNSKSSGQTALPLYCAFLDLPTCLLSCPLLPACGTSPYTLRTNLLSLILVFLIPLSSFSPSKTMKKCNVMPSLHCATSPLARRRTRLLL